MGPTMDAWDQQWMHGTNNGCMGPTMWMHGTNNVDAWDQQWMHGTNNGCMGPTMDAWDQQWMHGTNNVDAWDQQWMHGTSNILPPRRANGIVQFVMLQQRWPGISISK
jgi:hypothetical protein